MAQKKQQTITVRMERLPNRRAIERVQEAYHQLSQAADNVKQEKPIQEAQHEPASGNLCQSIDLATRTGSDDGQPGGRGREVCAGERLSALERVLFSGSGSERRAVSTPRLGSPARPGDGRLV